MTSGDEGLEREVEPFREKFKRYIAKLSFWEPFLGSILHSVPVYVIEDDRINAPAVATERSILINLKDFKKYKDEEQIAILAHEALHLILSHVEREKNIMKKHSEIYPEVLHKLINIVADAKVNQILTESQYIKLPSDAITPNIIEERYKVQNVKEKSLEEIIEEILSKKGILRMDYLKAMVIWLDLQSEEELQTPAEAQAPTGGKQGQRKVLINEGDPDLRQADQREIGHVIREIINRAATLERMAGRGPGLARRVLGELHEPKLPWRLLLEEELSRGAGRRVRRTLMRPSRKRGEPPGKGTLSLDNVVVRVDTSGSISEKEITDFISEVRGIVREKARVIVIPWDSVVYEPIVIRSSHDIEKVKANLRGLGGTEILPALELVDEKFGNVSAIVI
ncbi:MAG: VWA-like domain-containing protein, partial [Candidatus Korarchaeum sp.]